MKNNIDIRHWTINFFRGKNKLTSLGYCGTSEDVESFAENFLENINGTNYQIQER